MNAQTKLADNFFRDFAYPKAAELYLEAVKQGDSSEHVLTRLGDCYYNYSKVKKAAFWYKEAINKYDKVNPEYIYKYIMTQRSLENYDEANIWLIMFRELQKDDRRTKGFENFNLEKFHALKSTERVYVDVKNLNINTQYSDFGAFEKDGMFFFSSSRAKDTITDEDKLYQWNREPYLNVYQANINIENTEKTIDSPEKIYSDEVNTEFHEGSAVISNDGQTLYFTRVNLNKRDKVRYDKEGTSNLKLFKATRQNDRWGDAKELPFNDKIHSTGSPALSPDGKTLFFSSDREGGYGQTDIYKVAINEDGTFGRPVNLGGDINSEGKENFPFVAKDSTLYFSSDAYLNLGLYDIFESNILKKNIDKVEIKNLGAPYNSGFDDFGFFIDSETGTGYFSSNRPQGKGGDDIYAFGKLECKQVLKGTTKDKISLEPLPEVVVKLIDESGKVIEMVTSDEEGYYEFKDIACEQTYTVLGEKIIYRPDKREFTTSIVNGEETIIDLFLTPLIIDNEIVINPIFFDFDKWNIRPDAAYELENIVIVMREHSKMVIKIQAHTDCRGSDAYNRKLSDRRAKSTRDHLYTRGIAIERIESAIGYGESQLVNKCDDGVKCTEEEHQENRRSKFIITRGYTPGSK